MSDVMTGQQSPSPPPTNEHVIIVQGRTALSGDNGKETLQNTQEANDQDHLPGT